MTRDGVNLARQLVLRGMPVLCHAQEGTAHIDLLIVATGVWQSTTM